MSCTVVCFFFFNDTATTEIYTLSLHDALPILFRSQGTAGPGRYGDDSWLWLASRIAVALYDDELALVLLDRHVRLAREAGALAALPAALEARSITLLLTGAFAYARSEERRVGKESRSRWS